MKYLSLTIFLLWLSSLNSQNKPVDYSNVKLNNLIEKLANDSKNLEIVFLHPKNSNQVNLNKGFVVKKFVKDFCSEEKFNSVDNYKIIKIFKEFNLLENCLLGITKTNFVYHFKSKEEKRYSPNKAKLLIELIYLNQKSTKEYYFLIVENSKTAWKLLNRVKKETGMKKCFRSFKKSIFQ